MTITPQECVRDVEEVGQILIESGHALTATKALFDGRQVSWAAPKEGAKFIRDLGKPSTGRDYMYWLNQQMYSIVLSDASLMQLSYSFDTRGRLKGHRLAYVPCPVDVDSDDLVEYGIAEAVDLYTPDDPYELPQRSSVRFDFDPESAGTGHPEVHLTVNSVDCRIPVYAPLSPGRFARFILSQLYGYSTSPMTDVGNTGLSLRETDASPHLDSDNESLLHVRWRRA